MGKCGRCGNAAIRTPRGWRHARLADCIACTVLHGPMTVVNAQEPLFEVANV